MDQNNILNATLQEIKLTSRSNISAPTHSRVRLDRDRGIGWGIDFLIHNSIHYSFIAPPDPGMALTSIDQPVISISPGSSNVTVVNIYINPTSSCPSGTLINVDHLLEGDNMGDFNAHHRLWHSNLREDEKPCTIEFNRQFTTHPARRTSTKKCALRQIHKLVKRDEVSFKVSTTIKATKAGSRWHSTYHAKTPWTES